MYVCAHVSIGVGGSQNIPGTRVTGSLGHMMWVLGSILDPLKDVLFIAQPSLLAYFLIGLFSLCLAFYFFVYSRY